MFRKAMSFVLVSMIILGLIPISGYAERAMLFQQTNRNDFLVRRSDGRLVTIIVEDAALGKVNVTDIVSFAEAEGYDTDHLTLSEVHRTATSALLADNSAQQAAAASGTTYKHTTTRTYDKSSSGNKKITYTGYRKQVMSCAKGETVTLSSAKTISWSGGISGEWYVSFKVGATYTETYSTSYVFSGPPESSAYNSRIFYVGYDVYSGTYVQKRDEYVDGVWKRTIGTKNGTFLEPIRSFKFSKDYKR